MSFTVSYGCWLYITFSSVPCICCMSVTVSYGFWPSLTLSLSSMELQRVSHFLLLLLALSHYLSGPMELLHVSHCLL